MTAAHGANGGNANANANDGAAAAAANANACGGGKRAAINAMLRQCKRQQQ